MHRSLYALALLVPTALLPVACGGEAQCLAAPVCGEGEIEVESCDGQADCRTVETCGVSIGCVPGEICEGLPWCEDGYREVDECPAGVTCEPRTTCGTTIICAPDACDASDDCLATEFCDFADDRCGEGEPGRCVPRPDFCSDGPNTCLCDGTITDMPCAGMAGQDFDARGTCAQAPEQFACGARVCDAATNYCQLVTDDTGGPPYASCGFLPEGCADCSCLTADIEACGGTCVDGAFPTITCPGG